MTKLTVPLDVLLERLRSESDALTMKALELAKERGVRDPQVQWALGGAAALLESAVKLEEDRDRALLLEDGRPKA